MARSNATVGEGWLSEGKLDFMKLRLIVFSALMIVLGSVFSCKKNGAAVTRMGKLVATGGCAHYIVKLLDMTSADSNIVTASWTDPNTDSSYSNVFGVSDDCTFAQAGL